MSANNNFNNYKNVLQEQEQFRKDLKKFLEEHNASLDICVGESLLDDPTIEVTIHADIAHCFDLHPSEYKLD